MRTREQQMLAQEFSELQTRLDFGSDVLSVNRELNFALHQKIEPFGARAPIKKGMLQIEGVRVLV
jgi:hypothetical protein